MGKNNIVKAGSAFKSGMRGNEKEHSYHPNQSPTNEIDEPEKEQDEAEIDGVKEEVPSVFTSGMRGNEKYSPSTENEEDNPLESEVKNSDQSEAVKGLPAGSEIIGSNKTHHIVRVPIGKDTTKAVPQ